MRLTFRMFGSDLALRPCAYAEKDWAAEEYSTGCYTSVMGPSVLTQYARYVSA